MTPSHSNHSWVKVEGQYGTWLSNTAKDRAAGREREGRELGKKGDPGGQLPKAGGVSTWDSLPQELSLSSDSVCTCMATMTLKQRNT